MKNVKSMVIAVALFTIYASNELNAAISTAEKTIKSKIENVTVFLQGAQVHRSGTFSINAGVSTLLFDNLEGSINAKSIQASGMGSFIIMNVEQNNKYPEPKEKENNVKFPKNYKQIKLLQDSLVMIDFDLESTRSSQDALNIERSTLLNNRLIKGETKKDTLNLVRDAMSFLHEKLISLNAELIKLKKEEFKITQKKMRMQSDLDELTNFNLQNGNLIKNEINYEVIVTVSADAATTGTLNINYFLNDAGWTPSYDLRAESSSSNLQLIYKAQVYQNTGIDWNDIKLTLSTANPNQNNSRPVLSTWWLNYYSPYNYDLEQSKRSDYNLPQIAAQGTTLNEIKEAKSTLDFTTSGENFSTVEYEIKLAYSIPSDGKTHFVSIQSKDITANFSYFSVPKIDKDAFLIAKISNWDDLNLVTANANIYFDGTFIGETTVNANNPEDTLEMSLGRDKNMVVTRVKLKDKTKEKIIGEEKTKTVSYEITIRNTKSVATEINLQDQIPVSQNKEVVIELKDSSGGILDENTGLVNWKFNLKPRENKKITLVYTIKSPKTAIFAGL